VPADSSGERARDAARAPIILATTSSTYDTGLLDELIPRFEASRGRTVKTIAVGSGKALALGQNGEADLLLVHAPEAEERFMESGSGLLRRRLMYNDFILVGPSSDPAGVAGARDVLEAMRAIAGSSSIFVSRGDESGTHQLEMKLWERMALRPQRGDRYLETGQGMGATLRVASEKGAYTLTDRGTFLSQEETLDLKILFEGDALLRNVYHLIVVDPRQGARVNVAGAESLVRFFLSAEALDLLRDFGRERYGRPLFVPDAEPYGTE
jgi:tungstate transport system substrate-binding protein